MTTFHIKSETAHKIRMYAVDKGIKPARPQQIAPGIETVTLEPMIAIGFSRFLEEANGDADKAVLAVLAQDK